MRLTTCPGGRTFLQRVSSASPPWRRRSNQKRRVVWGHTLIETAVACERISSMIIWQSLVQILIALVRAVFHCARHDRAVYRRVVYPIWEDWVKPLAFVAAWVYTYHVRKS